MRLYAEKPMTQPTKVAFECGLVSKGFKAAGKYLPGISPIILGGSFLVFVLYGLNNPHYFQEY